MSYSQKTGCFIEIHSQQDKKLNEHPPQHRRYSMSEMEKRPASQTEPGRPVPPRVVGAWELFRGAREIWIEHAGVRYRLRITRRNKLILQK
jgi:hemin uptake protein HemP